LEYKKTVSTTKIVIFVYELIVEKENYKKKIIEKRGTQITIVNHKHSLERKKEKKYTFV